MNIGLFDVDSHNYPNLPLMKISAWHKELFSKYPLKRVFVFPERVQCAKNAEFERMKESGGSAVAYAWFVWQKGYAGKTIIDWLN